MKILLLSLLILTIIIFFIFKNTILNEKVINIKTDHSISPEQIKTSKQNDITTVKTQYVDAENAVLQNADQYLSILKNSSDPKEKREIRYKFSDLKPADKTLDFLLIHYNNTDTTDEELKLHIQSIVTHIDPSGHISRFKEAAKDSFDEALFISLIFSLKKADEYESKKALIDLIDDNKLDDSKQGINAIYRVLSDAITQDDVPWLYDFVEKSNLSDLQIHIIARVVNGNPSSETLDILHKLLLQTNSEQEATRIYHYIRMMENNLNQ